MAIGLDIGSTAVRAVELQQRRGGPVQLRHHGQVALPPGAVVDGDVVEPAQVTAALRELWGQAGLRRRAVAVGLASQRVTVRQIDLPELPDAELAAAVRLQAQDQLPIPVDQALLDHVVVEHYAVADGKRNVRVLLVAAERDMVDRRLDTITAAKLRPVVVDLDAFALFRSLGRPAVADTDVELVVDIGATVTTIAVHRGGHPLFVRMVRLGGDAVTRRLQDVLDLSWEEAEAAKLGASRAIAAGADVDPDDERARVLHSGVQRVTSEVRDSLEFFRGQHDDVEVQRVLLCGGASWAPELVEVLHSKLELPVQRGDPLRALTNGNGGGEHAEPEGEGASLAVPMGLALGLLQ